jgi:hypothetical protein
VIAKHQNGERAGIDPEVAPEKASIRALVGEALLSVYTFALSTEDKRAGGIETQEESVRSRTHVSALFFNRSSWPVSYC